MNANKPDYDDWLALAGSPKDPGLYFVGAYERRITFYSQQVRALRLAHAFSQSGHSPSTDHIAVVGAGAAGVTAALALALLGYDVALYDPATSILQLQSASPRLLHPHIYEWPTLGSLEDRAGLPILDWTASTGGVVCAQLKADFEAADTRLKNLVFHPEHSLTAVEKDGALWRLRLSSKGVASTRTYNRVVLAMGFGDEIPCGAAVPTHYWKQSSTGSAADEPVSPATYIVSGNGDGGLTDLLNLLIKEFEHVAFTRGFLDYFQDDALRAATTAAFAGVPPGADLEPAFRIHLLPLLTERGVLDRIQRRLRADRQVTINCVGPLLAATQAAQLNQVMAFAVLEAAKDASQSVIRSVGKVADVTGSVGHFQVHGIEVAGAPLTDPFQTVILRHGPNRKLRYKPAGGHLETYRLHVEELLKAKPQLGSPPGLAAETYDLFQSLRIDQLEDHAARPVMKAAVAAERAIVMLGVDPAAHVATEQGLRSLADVADQCERLPVPIAVQFTAGPTQTPQWPTIIRLARASGGRISLCASAATVTDWLGVIPTIAAATSGVPSHWRPAPLIVDGLAEAVDACLLRLLDTALQTALATNVCTTLGPIHPTIATAITPTWAAWRASLAADTKLLADFLRWLANVEQREPTPWTGDHGQLLQLTAALLMILATHHGEALVPALVDRGNLSFGHSAVALGSGCQWVGQQPVAVWTRPDEWDVDAIILSGSAEVEVLDLPGRVLDAGAPTTGIAAARRVRPVVIRNDRIWRARLAEDLSAWRGAVAAEFEALRARQDQELAESTQ
ncbi:ABC-three component system protein [Brevundimonas sp. SL161]|uniref:ABC-three component system protein n=1 Tax=Brevundimonas sp. SL161 TaxID=2804613 RepID=UPI003CF84532